MKQTDNNKNQQAEIEALKSVKIHTIPEEFYNGASGAGVSHKPEIKQNITEKKQESAKPTLPSTQKIPQIEQIKQPKPKQQSNQFTHKQSSATKWIIISGIILTVVLLSFGGYFYWQMNHVVEPEITNEIVENTNVIAEPELALEPEPIVESEKESETKPIPDYPIGLREYNLSQDTDLDGLSDIEEKQVYDSDAFMPDGDKDGYVDGHEVYHLYNPAGFTPVNLIDSGLIKVYVNSVFGYKIFYPEKWNRDLLDKDGVNVLFTSQTGEFIEVIIHPNKDNLDIKDWYLENAPKVRKDETREIITKRYVAGLISPDALSMFVKGESIVFELRYDIGVRVDANFMRSFQMMQNSFEITSKPSYIPEPQKYPEPVAEEKEELFEESVESQNEPKNEQSINESEEQFEDNLNNAETEETDVNASETDVQEIEIEQ